MIRNPSILICLLGATQFVFGAGTNETMTKVVYRDISTNVLLSSYAATPRTLYRMGERFGRSEEMPDPALGIHGLLIVNEPDAWTINLMTTSGVHMVDGGPTYVFHASIVSPPDPNKSQAQFRAFGAKSISKFEFGLEMNFLKKHGGEMSGPMLVNNQSCDRYRLTIDGYSLELFAKTGTEIPYQLKVSKDQALISHFQYDTYQTDLQPDLSLFRPPTDIKFSEAAR